MCRFLKTKMKYYFSMTINPNNPNTRREIDKLKISRNNWRELAKSSNEIRRLAYSLAYGLEGIESTPMEIQQAELVIMRNEELLKDILQGIQLNKIEIKKLDDETN